MEALEEERIDDDDDDDADVDRLSTPPNGDLSANGKGVCGSELGEKQEAAEEDPLFEFENADDGPSEISDSRREDMNDISESRREDAHMSISELVVNEYADPIDEDRPPPIKGEESAPKPEPKPEVAEPDPEPSGKGEESCTWRGGNAGT